MIISNIIGGLGNQMFQYAAAKALSLKLGTELKLDIRGFSQYQLHQGFELLRLFNCEASIANNNDLKNVLSWQKSKHLIRLLRKDALKKLRNKNYVVEPHFNYWKAFNQLQEDVYLDGYWQSEKYFNEYADVIRKEFTFKPDFVAQNIALSNNIAQTNAVSLHVRRGDYVSNPKNGYIGVCSLDYYSAAIDKICSAVSNSVFYIFSDDTDWVKSHLNLKNETVFVNHNKGLESYNDMRLMSLCEHHIIANSSFSWWGAWLGANPDKIVIAPKKWFASDKNDSDLVPENWLKL